MWVMFLCVQGYRYYCGLYYVGDVPMCAGVQILLRDYDFTALSVFTDDDIIAMYPLVRHTNFRVGTIVMCMR